MALPGLQLQQRSQDFSCWPWSCCPGRPTNRRCASRQSSSSTSVRASPSRPSSPGSWSARRLPLRPPVRRCVGTGSVVVFLERCLREVRYCLVEGGLGGLSLHGGLALTALLCTVHPGISASGSPKMALNCALVGCSMEGIMLLCFGRSERLLTPRGDGPEFFCQREHRLSSQCKV